MLTRDQNCWASKISALAVDIAKIAGREYREPIKPTSHREATMPTTTPGNKNADSVSWRPPSLSVNASTQTLMTDPTPKNAASVA